MGTVKQGNGHLLSSPSPCVPAAEHESPFRKKIRIDGKTESSPKVSGGEEADNSNYLKGLRQLRGVGREGRLASPLAGGNDGEDPRSPRTTLGQSPARSYEVEADVGILARREKQIDYGKTTKEYSNYLKAIPKEDRSDFHPRTPNKNRKYSRRAWDGLIKQWRLNLHIWSESPQPELDFSQNGKIRKRRMDSGSDRTTSPNSLDLTPDEEDDDDDDEEEEKSLEKSSKNDSRKKKITSFSDRIKADAADSVFSSSWADEVEEELEELGA